MMGHPPLQSRALVSLTFSGDCFLLTCLTGSHVTSLLTTVSAEDLLSGNPGLGLGPRWLEWVFASCHVPKFGRQSSLELQGLGFKPQGQYDEGIVVKNAVGSSKHLGERGRQGGAPLVVMWTVQESEENPGL